MYYETPEALEPHIYNNVAEKFIDHSRWAVDFEIIYRRADGELGMFRYSAPATEMQDTDYPAHLFDDYDYKTGLVGCHPVYSVEVPSIEYRIVNENGTFE